MQLIGDDVWFEGYRVATLRPEVPSTIRGQVEEHLDQEVQRLLEDELTDILEQLELKEEECEGLTLQVRDLERSLKAIKAELDKYEHY